MIIRIENIGPVRKVDIDLSQPMIILTGLNGTGKTYVLYIIYTICRMFIYEKDFLNWSDVVNSHQKQKNGLLDVDKLFSLMLAHLRIVDKLINYAFGVEYGDDLVKETKITLLTTKKQFHDEIASKELLIKAEGIFTFQKEKNSVEFTFLDCSGSFEDTILVNYIVVKSLLFDALVEDIEPSDRSGLSTFNDEIIKGLENSKLSASKELYRQPLAIRRFLADMKDKFGQLSENSKYCYLADEIENKIMHGHLRVSESGSICYKKEGMNKEIPLSLSSSGVKTICSIILFLRNSAMDCNLIIIDEPEINLHPKYQILIARILARIVNAGIRLIISTHSDYIIRELNNMIMLSSIKDEETIKQLGYTKDETLSKDDVAPYYFEYQDDCCCVLGKEVEVSKTGFSIREIDEVINSQVETSQNLYETIEDI